MQLPDIFFSASSPLQIDRDQFENMTEISKDLMNQINNYAVEKINDMNNKDILQCLDFLIENHQIGTVKKILEMKDEPEFKKYQIKIYEIISGIFNRDPGIPGEIKNSYIKTFINKGWDFDAKSTFIFNHVMENASDFSEEEIKKLLVKYLSLDGASMMRAYSYSKMLEVSDFVLSHASKNNIIIPQDDLKKLWNFIDTRRPDDAVKIIDKYFKDSNTSEDFEKNIKNWKKIFGYHRIRDMVSNNDEMPILHLFFKSQFAKEFLCRETMKFDEAREPVYHKYEENIYDAAAASQKFIPYHAEIARGTKGKFLKTNPKTKNPRFKFSDSPSLTGQEIYNKKIIEHTLDIKYAEKYDVWLGRIGASRMDIKAFVNGEFDRFSRAGAVDTKKNALKDYSYLIMPYRESGHAFLVVALINEKDKDQMKCQALLLINSLQDTITSDIYKQGLMGGWERVFRSPEKPFFLDASLDLQYKILGDRDKIIDENCVIYSSDIAEAFIKMISDNPELHENIENLGENNAEAVKYMITSEIKKYMPAYFEKSKSGEYIPRKSKEVADYLKDRRVEVASDFIKNGPFNPREYR